MNLNSTLYKKRKGKFIMFYLALIGLIISLVGCFFHSNLEKNKAIICWLISYPISIFVLLKALINIFG